MEGAWAPDGYRAVIPALDRFMAENVTNKPVLHLYRQHLGETQSKLQLLPSARSRI